MKELVIEFVFWIGIMSLITFFVRCFIKSMIAITENSKFVYSICHWHFRNVFKHKLPKNLEKRFIPPQKFKEFNLWLKSMSEAGRKSFIRRNIFDKTEYSFLFYGEELCIKTNVSNEVFMISKGYNVKIDKNEEVFEIVSNFEFSEFLRCLNYYYNFVNTVGKRFDIEYFSNEDENE